MTTTAYNQDRADAFMDKMIGVLNGGALALMTSIGHRTRLFDTMADMPQASSAQVAEKAGLNERYVREWLGAMVTGEVIDYDPQTKCYRLPPEHASLVTREGSENNLAATMQWTAVLGAVEDGIVECFEKGGGLPYAAYRRFHEVMEEESSQTTVAGLYDAILPLVPGLTDKLTAGIEVLDVGCGRARALRMLAARFAKSRFTGLDLCEDAIATARAEATKAGLTNIDIKQHDVTKLGEGGRFDLITAFDVIHDQKAPAIVLSEIHQALKPDGVFLMQDIAGSSHVHDNIGRPIHTFIYTISCMHCMSVSLGQGGTGLGAAWGEEKALEMLREAGFTRVKMTNLDHDPINAYYIARR